MNQREFAAGSKKTHYVQSLLPTRPMAKNKAFAYAVTEKRFGLSIRDSGIKPMSAYLIGIERYLPILN
ncbi:MAG: hypothetical protein ACLUKQ_04945 [Peptococcaceae bacterium]